MKKVAANDAQKKAAQEAMALDKYKDEKGALVTSDNQVFFNENLAIAHSTTLADEGIAIVFRGDKNQNEKSSK